MHLTRYIICFSITAISSMSVMAQQTDKYESPSYYGDDNMFVSQLHEGLNAGMNLSAFTTVGGGRRQSGMSQSLSVAYLSPLGKRGWIMLGSSLCHTNIGSNHYVYGSLYGEVGYRITDQLSAWVYGQKNIGNIGCLAGYAPYGLYNYDNCWSPFMAMNHDEWCYGRGYYNNFDRIGASLRWTPSPSFSLQFSVEKGWQNQTTDPKCFNRHMYGYPSFTNY